MVIRKFGIMEAIAKCQLKNNFDHEKKEGLNFSGMTNKFEHKNSQKEQFRPCKFKRKSKHQPGNCWDNLEHSIWQILF